MVDQGRFDFGAGRPINRLGFGAMRITGDGGWGQPRNPEDMIRLLRHAVELGVDFFDTSDSYGPHVSEELIARALHPFAGLTIATKGGLVRSGPWQFAPVGRPEYLRQCVLMSLRRLRLERIPLWYLHRIDPKVPEQEQFDAIAEFQREGLVEHLGLSDVGVAEAERAAATFRVAAIQNRYNIGNRAADAVLAHCQREGVAFVPFFPGEIGAAQSVVDAVAVRLGATTRQVALAWLLGRSPCVLAIPGTTQMSHLEENVAAAAIGLTAADRCLLDDAVECAAL